MVGNKVVDIVEVDMIVEVDHNLVDIEVVLEVEYNNLEVVDRIPFVVDPYFVNKEKKERKKKGRFLLFMYNINI